MDSNRVMVGNQEIEVSDGHIYLAKNLLPSYDYVPWNLISQLIVDGGLTDVHLIDVGANVGDSLAHFRRFSKSPVSCIEPSSYFFEILRRNSKQFDNVKLHNKLLSGKQHFGRVKFASGSQTGQSSLDSSNMLWEGDYISFDELIIEDGSQYIIKSDTDGFDCEIINSLLDVGGYERLAVPIVFFEGPAEDAMRAGDFGKWLKLFSRLQDCNYNLLFLTNFGTPYAYAGKSKECSVSVMNAAATCFQYGAPMFHYFDILAFSDKITSDYAELKLPLPREFLRRD